MEGIRIVIASSLVAVASAVVVFAIWVTKQAIKFLQTIMEPDE